MHKVYWKRTKPVQFYKDIRIMADFNLHKQIADLVLDILPKGSNVLDYGAGQGALSQRLQDLGYTVLSADVAQENFKASTPFVQVDFNNPLETANFLAAYHERFDLVLGVEVIEHVENPWEYIRNLKSLTRPGGYILISTPNITSWYSRINFLFKGRFHQFEDADREYGHINPIAQDELAWICTQAGLSAEKFLCGGWLPRLWLSKNLKTLLFNLLGFFSSFFMRGMWDGWCIIALIYKP